jgi:putative transposase
MARIHTWEISDDFWNLVEPLIPTSPRLEEKNYTRKPGGGRKRKYSTGCILPRSSPCCAQELFGTLCPVRNSKARIGDGWPNMMRWKESPGFGKLPTDRTLKRHFAQESIGANPTDWGTVQNGVFLSTSMASPCHSSSAEPTGMTVFPLKPLPEETVIEPEDRNALRNLCLDAGYAGKDEGVKENGFLTHIRPRGEEKKLIERDPTFNACRWVIELTHSWFIIDCGN